ncbi:MAG: hypothetical protein NTX64_08615 [Elusimicrobia bacterium]|nr:hypothetical protein [Elusimicrobiota bacterium]
MSAPRTAAFLSLGTLLSACAAPAVVLMSPAYDASRVQRVALISFTDYPGMPGSGDVAAGTFDKYLLLGNYSLVERQQVSDILKEKSFQVSGAVNPATAHKLGPLLGVDALVFGPVTDFSSSRAHPVLVNIPQEHSEPIYGQVETVQKTGQTTIRTVQDVVTGYSYSQSSQIVPETQTVPAHVGMSVRLVSVDTGEVLWSASGSGSADDLGQAAEEASSQIMQAVAKRLKKGR